VLGTQTHRKKDQSARTDPFFALAQGAQATVFACRVCLPIGLAIPISR